MLFETLDDVSTLSESSFNQGYYEKFFIEEKKLGRGFRGSVFLCKVKNTYKYIYIYIYINYCYVIKSLLLNLTACFR
jgi:hypothetical protein